MSEVNVCQPCGACCAHFRVSFYWAEADDAPGGFVPAALTDVHWQDWQAALVGSGLEDCRWTPCYDCGACTGYSIEHIVASATPPAGGSQGTGQGVVRPPGASATPVTLGTKPVLLGQGAVS